MRNRYAFSILPFAMAMITYYVASHSPGTATLSVADTLLLMLFGPVFWRWCVSAGR